MNDDGDLLQPLLAGLSEHDRADMLQRLDRATSEQLHVKRTPHPAGSVVVPPPEPAASALCGGTRRPETARRTEEVL
jgi:hypothetical protein